MSGIGFLGAFLGGLASLLSPCSALLLPSFFAYAFDRVYLLMRRTFVFWIGLCLVLMPMGAGLGFVGSAVTRYRSEVTLIGGLVLASFGLMTLLGKGFQVPGIQRLTDRIKISSTLSVLALGAVYALAGFCAGPLLGAVLTMSAMGADPVYGSALMGVYALGMAAPLFLLAWLWDRFGLAKRTALRGRPVRVGPVQTHTTSLVAGLILIAIGAVFIFTDGTANLGGVLTVDAAYDLQAWLSRLSATAGDPVVILGVVLVLVAWRGYRLWHRRAQARTGGADETSAESASGQQQPGGASVG